MLDAAVTSRRRNFMKQADLTELSALLKVMVMLSDAPQAFISSLVPEQAELCTRGRQLRVQLPFYLDEQRISVDSHCPLPGVLRSLVAEYAATTTEDMWNDGLYVRAPRAKRPRAALAADGEGKEENEPPLRIRRSLRLH
jgi:hypothetical protein